MNEPPADVIGSPVPLAQRLRPALERTILELVVEAFEQWGARGFNRFGDTEVEFTTVLIGQMREVRRVRNLPFMPCSEQFEYSPEMFAGTAAPNRAPRIDISVWWDRLAENAYYTIECKRLAPGDLAKKYVNEGLIRFVSGKYAGATPAAAMIGYAITHAPEVLLDQVNEHVQQHPELTDSDLLVPTAPIHALTTVYESRHQRHAPHVAIRVTHLFLDVRGRPVLSTANHDNKDVE